MSLARTKRAALLNRLQDSVFGPLLEEGGQPGALADLNTQQLATCLFDLGTHAAATSCSESLTVHSRWRAEGMTGA